MTNTSFKIPLLEEVVIHIKAKKPEWPDGFIRFYAEKFWNSYQSQGWRLSNNVPMKDWKAAFASRWQQLKYKEDQDELAKFKPLKAVQGNFQQGSEIDYIQDIYRDYLRHPTLQDDMKLSFVYDEMKKRNLIKLTPEQVQICRNYGEIKGKAQAVKFVFDRMANNGQSFKAAM